MRLPRPRFTVRWLMVAVAVAGLGLGVLLERHRRFRRIALEHATALDREEMHGFGPGDPGMEPRAQWRTRMAEKYAAAADRPWLPIDPDPPEPK